MASYKSNTPKSLKEILTAYLDDMPYKKRLKRGMVLSVWTDTVGSEIASKTDNVHFEQDNLVVHVKNSAWRHEIHMKRFRIAKQLNKEVGGEVVKEIVVRS